MSMARKGTARKTQRTKPLEPVSRKAPRVLGRQAVHIGGVPDNFCAEDPEILEMFGLK